MNFSEEEIAKMRQEAVEYRDTALCGFGHIADKPYNCMGCKHYVPSEEICYPDSRDAVKEIAISNEEAEKYSMLACDFYRSN